MFCLISPFTTISGPGEISVPNQLVVEIIVLAGITRYDVIIRRKLEACNGNIGNSISVPYYIEVKIVFLDQMFLQENIHDRRTF